MSPDLRIILYEDKTIEISLEYGECDLTRFVDEDLFFKRYLEARKKIES